jgi:DNA polymerase III subunit epsilon
MTSSDELEHLAQHLEGTGDYRVLRRLVPRAPAAALPGDRIGIILDVETTGLDTGRDEVIEVAMVKFAYARGDRVTNLVDTFQAFNEPSTPLAPDIVELTGITDAMVAGHRIDANELAAFVSGANVIIAHNAAFDRKFVKRFWPLFASKHWACSATDIDWKALGFGGAPLPYLLAGYGLFHGAHRALDDCHATLEILARDIPGAAETALALLLQRARRPTFRIWAEDVRFELKELLKKRRYRWSDGSDGRPRSWYVDVLENDLEAELSYLKAEIYQRDVDINHRAITALDRFSNRL